MRDDGHMARDQDLERFAARRGLVIVDVSDVARHRRAAAGPEAAAEIAQVGRLMRDVMGDFATGVTVVTARGEGRCPGRHHRQRDLLGLARSAAAARLPGAELRDPCRGPRRKGASGSTSSPPSSASIPTASPRRATPSSAHEVEFHEHDLGVPMLPGALATIACEVEAIYPAGDHEIVVGLAHHLEHREPGAKPLVFYRGAYSEIQIEEDELAA